MNANGRRQRQARNGFAHLAPRQRPGYKQMDAAASQRKMARLLETEKRIRMGSKKKK